MYTQNNRQFVNAMGNWLGETDWDFFSTITYRHNVKEKQNYNIMQKLKSTLNNLHDDFKVFYVTEFTNYNYNTHNHLLVKGDGIIETINSFYIDKGLIGDHVKHIPYEKDKGAHFYVSKYISSSNIDYNFIIPENK